MAFLQTYALPLAGALLLHALVAFFFSQGVTSQNDDIAQVITPTVVNAKLMVVEAPAVKTAPKPARKAPPVKSSVPKPAVVKTKPAQESKPQLKATQVDTAEAERQRKALADQRRRERLAALGELADDSLQRSLDAEAEQMLEAKTCKRYRAIKPAFTIW